MRYLRDKRMPMVVRVIGYVIGVVSLIFVVIWLVEKIRQLIHWTSIKNHFYILLICALMIGVCAFLLAQFKFGLDPWGQFVSWLQGKWELIRQKVGLWVAGSKK